MKRYPASLIPHALFALALIYMVQYVINDGGNDLYIYRLGAETIANGPGGVGLYEVNIEDYPFTYPPFAAIIFVPFALIPKELGMAIMMLITAAVAWWLGWVSYRYINRYRQIPLQQYLGPAGTASTLALLIWSSGPWRLTTHFGQVNAVILLLVLADFLRPATRVPRGVLIGIAGGIKLTPLAFGLILLMRKDYRGLVAIAAGFLGTIALGFLVVPQEALYYWGVAARNTSRIGSPAFYDNVSLVGIFAHAGAPTLVSVIGVLVLDGVLLVMVATLLRPLIRARMLFAQLSLAAFLMLEISPISWSHHNTWYPVLVLALCLEIFPLILCRAGPFKYVLAVFSGAIALAGMYLSPFWLAVLFSPQYSSRELIYLPQGGPGLIAASAPYAAMYILVTLAYYSYRGHRQDIDRAATEWGKRAEPARALAS